MREVSLDVLRTLPGGSDVAPKLRFGHVELSPEPFQAIQEYMLSVSDSDQAPEPWQTSLTLSSMTNRSSQPPSEPHDWDSF